MLGFFSGVVLAVLYRNQGPQQPVYEWMEEEESSSAEASEDKKENGGMGEKETGRIGKGEAETLH